MWAAHQVADQSITMGHGPWGGGGHTRMFMWAAQKLADHSICIMGMSV